MRGGALIQGPTLEVNRLTTAAIMMTIPGLSPTTVSTHPARAPFSLQSSWPIDGFELWGPSGRMASLVHQSPEGVSVGREATFSW